MKALLAVLSALLLAFIGYFAYRLDQWVGIVAFTYPYLFFCTVVGLLYWGHGSRGENTSVRVSLLSQQSGNCTALIINTKDGVVVSSEYSPD